MAWLRAPRAGNAGPPPSALALRGGVRRAGPMRTAGGIVDSANRGRLRARLVITDAVRPAVPGAA